MREMELAERMTAEEYLARPAPRQGRPQTELIEGEVVVKRAAASAQLRPE
jgi:hypothetical protein